MLIKHQFLLGKSKDLFYHNLKNIESSKKVLCERNTQDVKLMFFLNKNVFLLEKIKKNTNLVINFLKNPK